MAQENGWLCSAASLIWSICIHSFAYLVYTYLHLYNNNYYHSKNHFGLNIYPFLEILDFAW